LGNASVLRKNLNRMSDRKLLFKSWDWYFSR